MRQSLKAALGLIFLLVPGAAMAAPQTCTVTATSLAFGVYFPFSGTPDPTSGTITVSCTATRGIGQGGRYTIAASAGDGSFAQRLMKSGAFTLPYQLYTTAADTTVWGDGTGGTSTIPITFQRYFFNASQTVNYFGNIAANENAAPGAYTDTILVTVTY